MTPFEYADQAAEAIRSLNHASLSGTGYIWPADVDAVIGELHRMAQSLPHALGQAITWLNTTHGAGGIGHDHGDNTDRAVDGAVADLAVAAFYAQLLAACLSDARAHTTHLTGVLS